MIMVHDDDENYSFLDNDDDYDGKLSNILGRG